MRDKGTRKQARKPQKERRGMTYRAGDARAHAEVGSPPASPHASPSPNPHTRRPGPEWDHSSGKESRSRRDWEARKREELHHFLHIPHQDRSVLVENKRDGRQNPWREREQKRRERQEERRERQMERTERE